MRPRHRSRRRWLGIVSLMLLAAVVLTTGLVRHDRPPDNGGPASPAAGVSPGAGGAAPAPSIAPAGVGRQAPSQVPPQRPEVVGLPSGATMPVDLASTGADGVLDLPTDIDRAGWWDGGSRIGEPYGSIVLAAHVDSVTDGIGPFAELLDTRPGQRIRLEGSGSAQQFEVASVRLTPRASLSERTAIFSVRGPLRLVLITCAGPFDADRGGYRDNLVVVANPVGRSGD